MKSSSSSRIILRHHRRGKSIKNNRRPQKILRRRFCIGLIISLFLGGIATIYLQFFRSIITTINTTTTTYHHQKKEQQQQNLQLRGGRKSDNNNNENNNDKNQKQKLEEFTPNPNVNYNVHAFYYPWYCTPQTDGQWMHWDHPLLPHWEPKVDKYYPKGRHKPPDDIGSSYYPQLGPYSSSDPTIIKQHFEWFIQAKIGVAVVSWLPYNQHDDNGPPIAERLQQLLDLAFDYGIKIALHMEPYNNRTPITFENDVLTIIQKYGNHPSLYKYKKKISNSNNMIEEYCELPFMYVYDQYRIPSNDWKDMFEKYSTNDDCTTIFPAITIALIVEQQHWSEYVIGNNGKLFDGGYTYFASNTFTFGSKLKNWKRLSKMAATSFESKHQNNNNSNKKLFIPSVGPGYDDVQVRPWNGINTHDRIINNEQYHKNDYYYDEEWSSAIDSNAEIVSITSFNEWHEGTQIEPAIPYTRSSSIWSNVLQQQQQYKDYGSDGGPMLYLDLTRRWVEKFTKKQKQKQHH